MLHLDHPSSLSPPLISHSDLPWSSIPRDNVHRDKSKQPQPPNPDLLSPERPLDLPHTRQPDEAQTAGLVNDASRQSTPLSELSSPSERAKSLEPTDTPENSDKAGTDSNRSATQDSGWRTEDGREKLEGQTDGTSEGQSPAKDAVAERQTMEHPPTHHPDPSASGFNPSQPSRSTSSPQSSSRPSSVSYRGQSTDPIPRKQSVGAESISNPFPAIPSTPTVASPANYSEQKLDTKVVTILELNAELLRYVFHCERLSKPLTVPHLRVGMEFQTRGVPMNDPRFTE